MIVPMFLDTFFELDKGCTSGVLVDLGAQNNGKEILHIVYIGKIVRGYFRRSDKILVTSLISSLEEVLCEICRRVRRSQFILQL